MDKFTKFTYLLFIIFLAFTCQNLSSVQYYLLLSVVSLPLVYFLLPVNKLFRRRNRKITPLISHFIKAYDKNDSYNLQFKLQNIGCDREIIYYENNNIYLFEYKEKDLTISQIKLKSKLLNLSDNEVKQVYSSFYNGMTFKKNKSIYESIKKKEPLLYETNDKLDKLIKKPSQIIDYKIDDILK